jgi:hypothetical protein
MRNLQRLGILAVLVIGLSVVGSAGASAASTQISGVAVLDTSGNTRPLLLPALPTSGVTRRL